MWKPLLYEHVNAISAATANARTSPLANAINGQNCRLFERRRKECGSRVRFVVLGKKNLAVEMQLLTDNVFDPYFAFDPDRHCFEEGRAASWCKCQISRKQPCKFQQRLFVKRDYIKISRTTQAAQ